MSTKYNEEAEDLMFELFDEDEVRTHGLGHARESCGALAHLRNGTRRAVKQA